MQSAIVLSKQDVARLVRSADAIYRTVQHLVNGVMPPEPEMPKRRRRRQKGTGASAPGADVASQ